MLETKTTFNPLAEPDLFIAVPRWVFTRMTPDQQAVYNLLLEQCDYETGIWRGTSFRIAEGTGLSLRVAQKALQWLDENRYVKVFHHHGERGSYNVAIHGYRVRVKGAEHFGEMLDALSTTEDEGKKLHPVYKPTANGTANDGNDDSSKAKTTKRIKSSSQRTAQRTPKTESGSTANGQRTDSEPTANEQRTDSEPTANGYSTIQYTQDSPDLRDKQDSSTSSTTPDEFFPDVDDAVPASPKPGHPSGDGQGLTKERLVAELRRLMKERFYPDEFLNTTKAHVARAFTKAKEVGQDTFLAAWFSWLETARRELRVPVGKEQDKRTGGQRTRYEWRTWPLQYFLDSGAADRFIDEVRETRATLAGLLESWRAEVAEERGEDDDQADVAKGGVN